MNEIPKTAAKPETAAVSLPSKASFKKLADCNTLQEAFETRDIRDRISEALPKHMDPTSMLRTFVQAASKTPLIYQCDFRQAIGAFLSIAYLGLTPNTPLQLVHMIPFKTKRWSRETRKLEDAVDLNVIIGYPGYLELAHRSGLIQSVHCDVVLPGEHFRFEQGSHKLLEHRKEIDQDTTGLIPRAAYAYVDMKGEGAQFEVMSWHEIMRIRDRSQAYRTALAIKDEAMNNGKRVPRTWFEAPWVRDEREMAKKTPFRLLAKWLPRCPELRMGVAMEDAQDRGRLDYGAVIDGDATPMSGIPIDDEAPPADPGTAHTDRRAASKPAREDDGPPDWMDEAPPATPPARGPAKPAPATPPAFETLLIDQHGEIIDTPHIDPVSFARAFIALWSGLDEASGAALIEHNEGAIEEAREASEAARAMLAVIDEPPAPGADGQTKSPTIYGVVEPPVERGKVAWPAWLRQLKIDLSQVEPGDVGTWLDVQRETLLRAPMAQRVLAIQTIVAAFATSDTTPPPWLGEAMRPAPAQAATPPADKPAEPQFVDERWVIGIMRDVDAITTRAAFDELVKSAAVQSVMMRLNRENKPLFDRANRAFVAKHKAVSGEAA